MIKRRKNPDPFFIDCHEEREKKKVWERRSRERRIDEEEKINENANIAERMKKRMRMK